MCVREALSWIKELHLSNIIVESGSLLIINALNNYVNDSSSLGLIVDDGKNMDMDIQSCSFVFVSRSANQTIHALTRVVCSMFGLEGQVYPVPYVISDVIIHDLV